MQNKYLLFLGLAASLFLLAYSNNPPNQRTGAPGEGLCSDCHSLNGGTQDGNIIVSGFPSVIIPNQSYILTITANNPNGVANEAGFELVVLNSANNDAGDLINPGSSSSLSTEAGREYWKHSPSQVFPVSNSVSWTVTWVAPVSADDEITYYAAGNIANGNNNDSGDLIVTTQGSGDLVGVDPLVLTITGTNNACNGDLNGTATASVSGGEEPYTYQWSNGDSDAMITNLAAGVYTLTVTDNLGLTSSGDVEIFEPPVLSVSNATINDVSCSGNQDGAITLAGSGAIGGTPGYSFLWSNGATGLTIDELAPGAYTVTVTDDNDCTASETFIVETLNPLLINNSIVSDESCAGENDGSIMIEVIGGEAPYFAEWSNGSIGGMINGLEPGDYTVTVTDANGCSTEGTFLVDEGSVVNAEAIITNVSCFGANDGEIELTEFIGNSPFEFEWSNGASGEHITNLSAGSYLVTITDAEGCSAVKVFSVSQPPSFTVTLTMEGVLLCAGDETIDISSTVNGGSSPYEYLWNTGDTGSGLNDVGAGTYLLTVTDNNGCTANQIIVITEPAALQVSVVTEDVSAQGANDGQAVAVVSGGVGTLQYFWNTGQTNDTITDLAPGVYSVTVSDENGCSGIGSGQVDDFGCTISVDLGLDVGICEGSSAVLTPNVTEPNGEVFFIWSTGETTSSITVNVSGEYCVTVSDASGCADEDCIIVDVSVVPVLSCAVTPASSPAAADGAIGCEPNPDILSYLWSNGATTPGITGLTVGEYCVTLTNAVGCTAVQCFVVDLIDCPGEFILTWTNELCPDDASGIIAITAVDVPEPITYNWSNGSNEPTVSGLLPGTYEVTITDGEGCNSFRVITINELPVPVITLDSIHNINGALADGGIYITATGVGPLIIAWTSPSGQSASTEDITGLSEAGQYYVAVFDSNLCSTVDSFTVELINGTNTIRPSQVKVYPVPATDWLTISLDKPIREVYVSGVDGRMMKHITSPYSNRIFVGDLQDGVYFLQISDGVKWYSAKMIR